MTLRSIFSSAWLIATVSRRHAAKQESPRPNRPYLLDRSQIQHQHLVKDLPAVAWTHRPHHSGLLSTDGQLHEKGGTAATMVTAVMIGLITNRRPGN